MTTIDDYTKKSTPTTELTTTTPPPIAALDQNIENVEEDNLVSMGVRALPLSPREGNDRDVASLYNGEVTLRRRPDSIGSALVPPPKSNSTGNLQEFDWTTNTKKIPKRNNSKLEGLVLQLVVPAANFNNNNDDNNRSNSQDENSRYLTVRSVDSISGIQNNGQPTMSTWSPNYQDVGKSKTISRMESVCSEMSGSAVSLSNRHLNAPPTTTQQKKIAFRDKLTGVLSAFYALFNITLGLVLYVTDAIETGDEHDETLNLAENFSLYLVASAFAYLLYLTIDIAVYMNKKVKYDKSMETNGSRQVEMLETPDGNYQFNIALPDLKKSPRHDYCLNKDKHSTNYYLKIGAAAFCFGHLIHAGLLLGYRIVFLTQDTEESRACFNVVTLILDIIYPVYSFLLLFFIFKYSNIIINKQSAFARFGVMHCLSASLCFWIWTIFRETIEILSNSSYDKEEEKEGYRRSLFGQRVTLPFVSQNGIDTNVNISLYRFTKICGHNQELAIIYKNYSPYLYPFSVEYSILIVGVLYIVWQNIGLCKMDEMEKEQTTVPTRECANQINKAAEPESNHIVHADCQAANKGILGGFFVLVFIVVSVILFFIAIYDEDSISQEAGFLINVITNLVLLSTLTVCCVLAYRQTIKLDISLHHHNLLDDLLLFICIPAFFLNGIFSIIPAIIYKNALAATSICLEVLQVVIQTPFILDGLRRCSNTKQLRKKKPGRELVTFLIIVNVGMWLLLTFEVKSHGLHDYRYEFYSKELWTVIGHMCLPLIMFYRFHSSVCIADIWKHAYEPSDH